MMFAHLSGRTSLRDIASQLGAQARRLYDLGVKGVKRSTLSDANQDRQAEFFESVFHHLYPNRRAAAPNKRFRFKYKLYSLFGTLDKNDQFFVTRMKQDIRYKVVERHEVDHSKGLTSDLVILLAGAKARECAIPLRRIGYRDPETGKHYVFLTNIRHLIAKTICDIYQECWQIELFFKWIKQNLMIQTLVSYRVM
jgi:hypothetical protein